MIVRSLAAVLSKFPARPQSSRLDKIQVLEGYHAVRRRDEAAHRASKDDRRARMRDRHGRSVVADDAQRPAVYRGASTGIEFALPLEHQLVKCGIAPERS